MAALVVGRSVRDPLKKVGSVRTDEVPDRARPCLEPHHVQVWQFSILFYIL
jgi:hypothetical protein